MHRLLTDLNTVKEPPLKIRGSLIRKEDLTASHVDVLGHFKTAGSITTLGLKVSGECSIAQSCLAAKVDILGSLRVRSLQAERVHSSGYLSAADDITAGTFWAKGALRLNSLTAAESVEIRLSARSIIDQIRTDGAVKVKGASTGFHFLTGPFQRLDCRLIEGAVVELERTKAEVVCGKRIVIGPGCNIQEVRYSEYLQIDKRSKVGSIIKLNGSGGTIR